MKVKTRELTGTALNWAVTKSIGANWCGAPGRDFSGDWMEGGPIIDRQKISTEHRPGCGGLPEFWNARRFGVWATGPTALVAAMRCHVVDRLGETVEMPDELV